MYGKCLDGAAGKRSPRKVRYGPHEEPDAVLVVSGVQEDGFRQHLGVWAGNAESEQRWSEVFAELKGRGLKGMRYVVSDDRQGIRTAVARHFLGALWQRRQVHFKRNVLCKVREPGTGSGWPCF